MGVIVTRQLTKRYGRRVGVDGIDLEVQAGSIYGFLGPNGAGKTTAIRILLGFLRPGSGRASVLGRDCWRQSPQVKRDVGYLPGDVRLYSWMTGRSALRIAGLVRGQDLRSRGGALLDRLELDPDVPVRRMSRGMRQKLGLLLALAHEPRVAILDEPTSGLDPLMRVALADHLRDLARRGHTVFFSSHTLGEVEDLCDRVAIVRRGRIVADESVATLRGRARRTVMVTFESAAAAGRAEPPPWLTVHERDHDTWRCSLDGAAGELVAWLASHPVRDVTISPPDLERLFRRYYEPGEIT